MQTPNQIKSSIISFLFFKIDFKPETNSFIFKNRIPLHQVDNSFFENDLSVIFKSICDYLVTGKENLIFLKDLIEIIDNKSRHFEKYYIDTLATVDDYFLDINQTKKHIDYYFVSDSDKEENNKQKQDYKFDEENKLEFIRVFNLAKNYAYILYQFVDGFIVDFDHFDFKEFDFDDYIKSHNLHLANELPSADNFKCIINFNKIDVAHLFHMLIDEGVFYFSDNKRNNKVMMQKFIEQNFLYRGKEDKLFEIKAINKEFSKVDYNGEELQLQFLKYFRDKIDLRIDKINRSIK